LISIVLAYNVRLTDERDRALRGEKNAKLASDDALQAKHKAEDLLVELNVTIGLSAEKANQLPEAALSFAAAARQAPPDSPWARSNLIRWQAFTAASPVPWRALRVPDTDRLDWLGLHPQVRWLITNGSGKWRLWDLDREESIEWPGDPQTVTAAA